MYVVIDSYSGQVIACAYTYQQAIQIAIKIPRQTRIEWSDDESDWDVD